LLLYAFMSKKIQESLMAGAIKGWCEYWCFRRNFSSWSL